MSLSSLIFIFILMTVFIVNAIDRDEIMDYIKYKQQTRTTFDGRIDQQVEPLGYVDGKPIWPRILQKVKSPGRILFDDDNFGYQTNERNVIDLVHKMDMEDNYNRVIRFLERFTH